MGKPSQVSTMHETSFLPAARMDERQMLQQQTAWASQMQQQQQQQHYNPTSPGSASSEEPLFGMSHDDMSNVQAPMPSSYANTSPSRRHSMHSNLRMLSTYATAVDGQETTQRAVDANGHNAGIIGVGALNESSHGLFAGGRMGTPPQRDDSYVAQQQMTEVGEDGISVGVAGKKITGPFHNTKYKGKLCKNWMRALNATGMGNCQYNEKCQFAHGEEEIEKWSARRVKTMQLKERPHHRHGAHIVQNNGYGNQYGHQRGGGGGYGRGGPGGYDYQHMDQQAYVQQHMMAQQQQSMYTSEYAVQQDGYMPPQGNYMPPQGMNHGLTPPPPPPPPMSQGGMHVNDVYQYNNNSNSIQGGFRMDAQSAAYEASDQQRYGMEQQQQQHQYQQQQQYDYDTPDHLNLSSAALTPPSSGSSNSSSTSSSSPDRRFRTLSHEDLYHQPQTQERSTQQKYQGRTSTRRASSYQTTNYSSRVLPDIDIGTLTLDMPVGSFQVKTASNTPCGSPTASPTCLSSPTILSSEPDRSQSLSPGPQEPLSSPRSLSRSPELGVSSQSTFGGFSSSLLTGFNSADRPSRSARSMNAYSQRRSGANRRASEMMVRSTIFESDEDVDDDEELPMGPLLGLHLNALSLGGPIVRPEHGSPVVPMSAPGSRSSSPVFGATTVPSGDDDSAQATANNVANQLFASRSLFSMPESEQE